MANNANVDDILARVTAKAWTDKKYKAKLLQDPTSVLQAEGVPLGKRQAFAHENTAGTFHFVLREKPKQKLATARALARGAKYTFHEADI